MTTPKPLWDEERIFSRISELTANRSSSLAPTIAAGLVLRELRDEYEADRATQAARIAELEAALAEARTQLADAQANEPPLWYKMGYDEKSVAQGDTE